MWKFFVSWTLLHKCKDERNLLRQSLLLHLWSLQASHLYIFAHGTNKLLELLSLTPCSSSYLRAICLWMWSLPLRLSESQLESLFLVVRNVFTRYVLLWNAKDCYHDWGIQGIHSWGVNEQNISSNSSL